MSVVLAIVPARAGSKGIPGKNFRVLGTDRFGTPITLTQRAIKVADAAGCEVVVSSDAEPRYCVRWLPRPAELAQDDTPMLAVVQHALSVIPGPPEQIILLLQPTAVFRKPQHLTDAIKVLEETGADSVVSVVPLPLTHHPAFVLGSADGQLWGYKHQPWEAPARRQDVDPVYIRDGTVYAFRRRTVEAHGSLYGWDMRALILDPSETCELDTMADWLAVEARWKAQHG